jgi:LysM repeat protein
MKWRDWQLLTILVLLCYVVLNIALMPLSEQWLSNPQPTHTPSPAIERAVPSPVIRIVLPTSTPHPTRTPVTPATRLATAPSLRAASTSTPTASLQPPPTATPTTQILSHVIQRGENLTGIALQYGITIQAIVEANNLGNPDLIYIGQKLLIPVPASPTAAATPSS